MVPEKMSAFSEAGVAVFGEWCAMHAAYVAEMQHLGSIAASGRLPTPIELTTLAARNASYAIRSVERLTALGTVALAPIHKVATGNAKRLKRTKKHTRSRVANMA